MSTQLGSHLEEEDRDKRENKKKEETSSSETQEGKILNNHTKCRKEPHPAAFSHCCADR